MYKTLVDADARFPFNYTIRPSPIAQSKMKLSTSVYDGTLAYGQTISIAIPRAGLNVLSYLKVTMSGSGPASLGFGGILYSCKQINLCPNDTIIETLVPEDILSRILKEPHSIRDALLFACGSNQVAPFGVLYVPLYFTCYEQLENALDAKFLQSLRVDITFCNSVYDIMWTASPDASIATSTYNANGFQIGMFEDGSVRSVYPGDVHSNLEMVNGEAVPSMDLHMYQSRCTHLSHKSTLPRLVNPVVQYNG